MRNKDHLMLEEAYTQIYKEKCENVNEPKEKNETFSNKPLPLTDPHVNYENFVHGIQPISEAKKKSVNPYAVCTASVGRKDEEKYKSCKKKVASGAKKTGKKVTTKPVKKK